MQPPPKYITYLPTYLPDSPQHSLTYIHIRDANHSSLGGVTPFFKYEIHTKSSFLVLQKIPKIKLTFHPPKIIFLIVKYFCMERSIQVCSALAWSENTQTCFIFIVVSHHFCGVNLKERKEGKLCILLTCKNKSLLFPTS